MRLPKNNKELVKLALEKIEECKISQGRRAAVYRAYGQWTETGRAAGGLALANMLYGHVDRLAAHLFSPSDLRFSIDYEHIYPEEWLQKGAVAARTVSREWERKSIDLLFGDGVKEALTYGACFLKHLAGRAADDSFVFKGAKLVMPWQFGVENESKNDLTEQEYLLETVYLNRYEVWRRVAHLPDAEKLYRRILAQGRKDEGTGAPTSFMHQVLSTAVMDTNLQNATRPLPGGVVQTSNDPYFATLGPLVAGEQYPKHELWVYNDEFDDYTTIELIEPDILISPRFKYTNLFVPGLLPYSLIQPNWVANYLWGRSEITDLQMLQDWLSTHLDDAKRLMGLQVDKIIGFEGWEGDIAEQYAQHRAAGFVSVPQGAKMQDLTPNFPPELVNIVREILALMDRSSGFPPIMSGAGEPGVRAGIHADTLVKTGSPRLRDRSLRCERQAANAGDLTLGVLEAKDDKVYWTDVNNAKSDFLLKQLPEDRRVAVDSHSSSPIYHDDHAQLIAWGVKAGVIDAISAIEELPFSHKDVLIDRHKANVASRQKFMLEHPEFFMKGRGSRGKPAMT